MTQDELKKAEIARVVAAYKDLFSDPQKASSSEIVIADLARECHFYESGWNEDVGRMQHLTGRREVFLYIKSMLNLTPELIEQMVVAQAVLTEEQKSEYDPLKRTP